MLIVAQGKQIVNLDSVEVLYTEAMSHHEGGGYRVVAGAASGARLLLGQYKYEEYASRVLKEILEKYEEQTRERAYRMP